MIGQGVLRECLLDPEIEKVVAVGRSGVGNAHLKLKNVVTTDLFDLSAVEKELTNLDACFFCLGVTSAGMSEQAYTRITHDLTVSIAQTLLRLNPQMGFIFVSGTGTDSTERGRTMWARVKGKAENAVLQMPFKWAYMFRPAFIQPMHGIRSRTALYRIPYTLMSPFTPFLRRAFPKVVTTTEILGRAMINVAKKGYPKKILETADINIAGSVSGRR
jgi:uncharacterized protein YbjT (DUF2867 family)